MSTLRVLGLLCSFIPLGIAFVRLRSHAENRTDVVFLFLFGLSLLLVSLVPGLVNLPADILTLGDHPRGRIITLLIISSAALWFFFFYERSKREKHYLQLDNVLRGITVDQFFRDNQVQLAPESILVVIPAYNEAENLRVLLPQIPRTWQAMTITTLVINDGSSDHTSHVAHENGALLARHFTNLGGGTALKAGYDIAKALGVSMLVTMDADGQHDPKQLPVLIEPIVQNDADFVIGSRMLGQCADYSKLRFAGVIIFSKFISLLLGIRITDAASGYRAISRKVLEESTLVQEQYHTSELIIEAIKHKFRILEQPITISQRLSGESKKGKDWKYALLFLRTIIKTWIR